LDVERWAFGI